MWATGFTREHRWIDVPVFDERGAPIHERGATASPGLYFLGLPWQHIDDPSWGRRNNPDCERNIARLLAHWRGHNRPLVFVRHDSVEPGSTLASGAPGNAFKDVITGDPDLLVTKSVNSSFHGE